MVNNLKLLIKSNIRTFISIALLVTLGVGFLVGMKSIVPNLKYTVNKYYDEYNVYDIELTSSIGFTEEDINEFGKINNIKKIEGTYSKDFIVNGKNDDFVLRVRSYNNDLDSINKLKLLEGNYPVNNDEIVIEDLLFKKQEYKIGEYISLDSDLLNIKKLKIVGVVKSPLYLSSNKGTTNLLSGRVNYYAFVNVNNINSNLYSTIYIKTSNNELDSTINSIKKKGKDLLDIRYEETIKEYNEKLDKGQKEFDSKKEDTENKIKKYEQEIANAELQILSAEKSIPTVQEAKAILNNKKNELAKAKKELDNAKTQIDSARKEYNNAKKEYDSALSHLNELKKQLNEYKKNGASSDEISELETIIAFYQSSIDYYKTELDSNKETLDEKQKEYNLAYDEYKKISNKLNANTAEELIEIAKKEVNEKKRLLNEKKKELQQKKQEVNDEFIKFQNQLDDAKDYLKLISTSGWNIDTRESNISYKQYLSDIRRIEKIGNFFPIIFYIVAVLITLTNISRIISYDRDKIGLYKALGYKNSDIGNDYIYFSIISCLIGCLFGTIIGLFLIPRIFYKVYSIIYYLPQYRMIINYNVIIVASIVAMILVILSTFLSIRNTIKEWPALLFRPKDNNKGKRVLLEKISFIWNHLNFTNKVTFRNMFKYPKRFIMTILGVSGCISLIIAGFNIKTSISNIIPLQFENLFDIDAEIFLKDSLKRSEILSEKERINSLEEIDSSMLSYIKYVYLNDSSNRANLVVPEDNDLLLDFVTLRNNKTKYELSNDGVIITKKIAEEMGINVGSIVKLKDPENNVFSIKIDAIVENYVDNYIYMNKNYYNNILGDYPKYNALLVRTKNNNFNEENLSKKFNENNAVSYLLYTSTSKIMYDTISKSLNYIVYILVISAVLLAFVVLYNLNSLNVEERKREIATIKVLGFNKKETYSYIENETKRLTFIGIIIGVILGYIFSSILIKSCELENLTYDYSINYLNYIYSIIITIIFMIITSIISRKNIEKIDMIESLKKVE